MQQVTVTNITPDMLFSQMREVVANAIQEIKNQEQEKLVSATEACKMFIPAIAKSTLSEWTTQGLIPVHRIGGRVFYKYSEVIGAAKMITKFERRRQKYRSATVATP